MRKYKIILGLFLIFLSFDSYAQVASILEIKDTVKNSQQENQDLLELKKYELKFDSQLTKRGEPHYYEGEYLEAIQFPVGGIGSGCIQYDGDAVPRFWQIFNNNTHDFVPNSFIALRIKQGDKEEIVRALQTKDVAGFQGFKSLKAQNEFPFIRYIFEDELPVSVQLRIYNPFIPTDLKNSSIPAVFYQLSVENKSNEPIEVELLAVQQNAVGLSQLPITNSKVSFAGDYKLSIERNAAVGNNSEYYGGNYNRVYSIDGAKMLYMSSTRDKDEEHYGEMALMLLDSEKVLKESLATSNWQGENRITKQVKSVKPSKQGESYTGAVSSAKKLKGNESTEFNLAMAWYFPNGINGGVPTKWDAWGNGKWHGNGNYYASQWASMDELSNYIAMNYKELYDNTMEFHNSLFATNLPYWAVERLSSQLSIIRSRTIFHDKDGYVGLWEGCGSGDGSCSGNCNHVWHYAQAHARLFPELGRKIRNQSYHFIKENGEIPYRQPAGFGSFDGQCGDIIATYREYLMSSDKSWLESLYPKVKKAVEYVIKNWDNDQDGWLSGNMHTTYDCRMSGNASFLTSLYLTMLHSAEQMAEVCGDSSQAKSWQELFSKGQKVQNSRLWNGEYYIQVPDTTARASDYENGCHSDQLLGQWWADQLGLGEIFPTYRVQQAVNSIYKYNFKAVSDFHKQSPREFAKEGEPIFIVTTWPGGDRPKNAPGYSDEIWTTYEYTIAASLFRQGQTLDALTLLKSGAMRYDGRLRTGYKGDWGNFGFSGNPFGDDECGQFYSRALCNWSVMLAIQGFEYDGPRQMIGFSPKWLSNNHRSFFSSSDGWGVFEQRVSDGCQVSTINLNYGNLAISTIELENELGCAVSDIQVLLNGKSIKAEHNSSSDKLMIKLPEQLLTKGDKLTVRINGISKK